MGIKWFHILHISQSVWVFSFGELTKTTGVDWIWSQRQKNYLLSQAEWGSLEIKGLGTVCHLDFLRRGT